MSVRKTFRSEAAAVAPFVHVRCLSLIRSLRQTLREALVSERRFSPLRIIAVMVRDLLTCRRTASGPLLAEHDTKNTLGKKNRVLTMGNGGIVAVVGTSHE